MKKDNCDPRAYAQPASQGFVFLGRELRYAFISCAEGEEDKTCLIKEVSSFLLQGPMIKH